jgi:hypothetical protein
VGDSRSQLPDSRQPFLLRIRAWISRSWVTSRNTSAQPPGADPFSIGRAIASNCGPGNAVVLISCHSPLGGATNNSGKGGFPGK